MVCISFYREAFHGLPPDPPEGDFLSSGVSGLFCLFVEVYWIGREGLVDRKLMVVIYCCGEQFFGKGFAFLNRGFKNTFNYLSHIHNMEGTITIPENYGSMYREWIVEQTGILRKGHMHKIYNSGAC